MNRGFEINLPDYKVIEAYSRLKSTRKVAKELSCSQSTIQKFIKELGLNIPNRKNKSIILNKESCFHLNRKYDKFKNYYQN